VRCARRAINAATKTCRFNDVIGLSRRSKNRRLTKRWRHESAAVGVRSPGGARRSNRFDQRNNVQQVLGLQAGADSDPQQAEDLLVS